MGYICVYIEYGNMCDCICIVRIGKWDIKYNIEWWSMCKLYYIIYYLIVVGVSIFCIYNICFNGVFLVFF